MAAESAGSNRAARMPMMAITTSNSIKVKPFPARPFLFTRDSTVLRVVAHDPTVQSTNMNSLLFKEGGNPAHSHLPAPSHMAPTVGRSAADLMRRLPPTQDSFLRVAVFGFLSHLGIRQSDFVFHSHLTNAAALMAAVSSRPTRGGGPIGDRKAGRRESDISQPVLR